MAFRIAYLAEAEAELAKLPKKHAQQILRKIDTLYDWPHCAGVKQLRGSVTVPLYRLRSGDYRVVFRVESDRLVILIVRIAHRKEVYR